MDYLHKQDYAGIQAPDDLSPSSETSLVMQFFPLSYCFLHG